jgi:hypothetical protein
VVVAFQGAKALTHPVERATTTSSATAGSRRNDRKNGKSNGRSRFPKGMTERKARARATTTARANADANAGVLRFAQDDEERWDERSGLPDGIDRKNGKSRGKRKNGRQQVRSLRSE